MAITENDIQQAEARMEARRAHAHATSARYDSRTKRVIIRLHSGLELAIPSRLVEGLAEATPEALSEIDISPSGLGLHWPQLDVDLYVPALLEEATQSERSLPMGDALAELGRKVGLTNEDFAVLERMRDKAI